MFYWAENLLFKQIILKSINFRIIWQSFTKIQDESWRAVNWINMPNLQKNMWIFWTSIPKKTEVKQFRFQAYKVNILVIERYVRNMNVLLFFILKHMRKLRKQQRVPKTMLNIA